MGDRVRLQLLLSTMGIVAAVGLVAAATAGSAAASGLFVLIVLLALGGLRGLRHSLVITALRPDLCAWLEDAAAIGAEPTTQFVERALSAVRADLDGPDRS